MILHLVSRLSPCFLFLPCMPWTWAQYSIWFSYIKGLYSINIHSSLAYDMRKGKRTFVSKMWRKTEYYCFDVFFHWRIILLGFINELSKANNHTTLVKFAERGKGGGSGNIEENGWIFYNALCIPDVFENFVSHITFPCIKWKFSLRALLVFF